MTIDEGIIILRDLDTNRFDFTHEQIYEAKKLGIEALKQIQFIRALGTFYYFGKLPGETNE